MDRNKARKKNTELYNQWITPRMGDVKSLIRYYISDHNQYDHIFSETCESLLKYIHTYNPEQSIDTWLHVVVKRKVFAEEKKHQRLNANKTDYLLEDNLQNAIFEEPSATTEDPLDMEFYKQHLSDIPYRALCGLDKNLRNPLLMLINGYSIKEITQHELDRGALDWFSVNAIKTRISIAKDTMRRKMRQEETKDEMLSLLDKLH